VSGHLSPRGNEGELWAGYASASGCEKENTTIVDGAGNKKDVDGRIAQIKAQIEANRLWTRGILLAPCFASRAVDQTRPLPPYSEPHIRLIEPGRQASA
jgi:hypothetical protein